MGVVFPDARSRLTGSVDYVTEEDSRGIRTDRQNNQTLAAALRYERRHDNGLRLDASAHARLLWRKVELGARPDFSVRDHVERDDGMRFGQSFQADFPLAGFNTISVGIDMTQSVMKRKNDYDLVERDSRARGKQLGASIFAQDEMRFPFGKHVLLVTPGVRLDYLRSYDGSSVDSAPGPNPPVDEDYPDRAWVAANPKLALVYRYDDWTTVRVSAGRSFAAPTLFELHTVFTRGPLLLYGNPDLDPETSWSAELGIDQRLGPGLLARATGYYTRGFDFIGYRDLGNNQSRLDNITEIQVVGVDTELRFDPHPMWSIYGGYTFNRSTVVKDLADAAIEGNRLPFEPVHRARLGVVFRYLEWVAVDLAARYEGERDVDLENTAATRLDDHFTLDLGLSGRFLDHVGWALAFENLLNRKYDVYSVPTEASEAPGFQVRGSLSFSF
jgi:outer membrane receptor protein involved in Fe transport